MEVCVDNLESALNAADGGATSLELCSSLATGGTTPTLGFLKCVKQKVPSNVTVHVLIRCRDGDFLYTSDEIEIMVNDVQSLVDGGADGIVIGCLDEHAHVNIEQCQKLIQTAKNVARGRVINITFHRAFDMTPPSYVVNTMKDILSIGCSRLLTSGQKKTAVHGGYLIRNLIEKYQDQIVIMPGGGLNEKNLTDLLDICCGNNENHKTQEAQPSIPNEIKEFHSSARVTKESKMLYKNEDLKMGSDSQEFSIMVTSAEKVAKMIDLWLRYK